MSRKEEILKGMNTAQQQIIKSIYGKYIANCTAGSGKVKLPSEVKDYEENPR